MEFIAATNNKNKLEEINRMLKRAGHTVVSLDAAGASLTQPEDGETFAENALIKAREVCRAAKKPTLADDSGLEVDALGGAPGVLSARFAGEHGDDEANNKKLMQLLERTPYAGRGARFVCAVAVVMPDGKELVAEGVCDGSIGFGPSGTGGFGYDPLFYVNNRSFADMSDEEKDAISHRARALEKLVSELPGFLGQSGAQAAVAPAPEQIEETEEPVPEEE